MSVEPLPADETRAQATPGLSPGGRLSAYDFEDPKLFSFDDQFAGLASMGRFKKRAMKLVRADVEFMRNFCRRHLRPLTLKTDLMIQRDHTVLAGEMLALAAKHRILTRMIPRFMGGESSGVFWSVNPCAEEAAAVEPAFQTGLLGGHGLGMSALLFSQNFRLMDWVADQTIQGEAVGRPFLLDAAITEPWAGTDVEEVELLPQARLMTPGPKNLGRSGAEGPEMLHYRGATGLLPPGHRTL